ncbi:FAD-dependent monooxygenase [Actinomadura kijaniata]|uniref:4,5-epoxidase n=1 Tax=Actinomadura namibiensis TaxID=182080 RepID=A0A7W3M0D8_ACTNM|nr:FAD-dependent monooxygenase [Actinomadura namibiensis]MBA8957533.1 4,5-epoxidase [Actinomadura namibiensis]
MERVDVLVVGAGPAGLVLACGLAAQGAGVRVVDRARGPASTSRANILHARGAEVLERLAAVGDLRERSLAPVGMRMHVRSRPIATMRFAPDERESARALFVSQARIEERLRRRLGELGGRVEWGRAVTGVTQDAGGVTAGFADGARVRAGWLAGCDGAHSTVREAAGIDFPGAPVVERFLLADVHADWDRDRTVSAGFFHRDGLLLAIPMRDADGRDDLWRLMADVPEPDRRLDAADIVARFERLLPERAGETGVRIRDAVWTSVFRIHRRLAADYRRGRVLLAGDAAHIHSPIGGQGMNTGIGDAENLAWKLALVVRGGADPALLDTYTAERRPPAAEVLRTTTANTRILVGEGAAARLVRDRIFVPLLNSPRVQRRATRTASQLGVSYRRGPLGGRGAGPRPGDRVPDREGVRADGSPSRLYAELCPAWVLLARPGADVAALLDVARERLGEDVTALFDAGAARSPWLVRPDGHLGWRGDDPAALRRWLTGALHTRMGA